MDITSPAPEAVVEQEGPTTSSTDPLPPPPTVGATPATPVTPITARRFDPQTPWSEVKVSLADVLASTPSTPQGALRSPPQARTGSPQRARSPDRPMHAKDLRGASPKRSSLAYSDLHYSGLVVKAELPPGVSEDLSRVEYAPSQIGNMDRLRKLSYRDLSPERAILGLRQSPVSNRRPFSQPRRVSSPFDKMLSGDLVDIEAEQTSIEFIVDKRAKPQRNHGNGTRHVSYAEEALSPEEHIHHFRSSATRALQKRPRSRVPTRSHVDPASLLPTERTRTSTSRTSAPSHAEARGTRGTRSTATNAPNRFAQQLGSPVRQGDFFSSPIALLSDSSVRDAPSAFVPRFPRAPEYSPSVFPQDEAQRREGWSGGSPDRDVWGPELRRSEERGSGGSSWWRNSREA